MPLVVGVPGISLLNPPAVVTDPVVSPVITAASLVPWIVMSICCVVPSIEDTLNRSCSVSPTLSALTVRLLLSSV
jgi:hypothetical protein